MEYQVNQTVCDEGLQKEHFGLLNLLPFHHFVSFRHLAGSPPQRSGLAAAEIFH
jgi:hypothetical protein